MATVKTNTDVFEKPGKALKELTGKTEQAFLALFKTTTLHMTGDESFLAGPTERSLHIKSRRRN